MLEKIQRQIQQHRLVRDGKTLLIGVSGGPDSVALLDAVQRLSRAKLRVCHLNHQLRGVASDGDERFVRALARKYHLPCHVGRRDVRALMKERKFSLEEAARSARLVFFAETAHALGLRRPKVALAHNADDQVETFLLRLLRGAGARGLSSMRPRTQLGALTIVRPLLAVTRAEILVYLRERKLNYRTDASNRDVSLMRNRIRHELLPLLERKYSAGIRAVLRRTAEILGEEDALLDALASRAVQKSALKKLPLALQRRVVRQKLGEGASFNDVERALENIGRLLPALGKQESAPAKPLAKSKNESFDADRLGHWSVRFWRAGDRMRPLGFVRRGGMRGRKKLQDIFTDAKIPAAERTRIPLVIAENGEIAWVVGVRMSEDFKVTARTRRRIRLSARRVSRSIALHEWLC